jgi:stage V sporulation protein D (sporulation-specific penicillin-binding protein)
MKESSADSLHAFLRGVVERGTAQLVNSDVVKIAGKTGTAQIPDLKNKRYFQGRFMASFAGFFPYDEPQLAGIVVVANPQPVHYGGLTAGPAFRKMAERFSILNPDKFTPPERLLSETSAELQQATEIPDLVGHTLIRAEEMAAGRGVAVRCNSDSGTIVWQFPPAGRLALAGDEMLLAIGGAVDEGMAMVDLKGLSMRKAMAFLDYAGVSFEVAGRGWVRKQSIAVGTKLSPDVTCRIECRTM